MSEKYFSEDGCDRFLAESGLLPPTGTWVDAGAAHPWQYSQTAFLRNRGWKGLAIDGNPAYEPEWKGIANAKFVSAVLSDQPTELFLIEPTNTLVSRVHEIGSVHQAHSLNHILSLYGMRGFDFLALDIEGMEASVLLQFFNQALASPQIIVVEYNSCHKGRDPEVFNVMLNTSYRLKHLTDSNAIFVR